MIATAFEDHSTGLHKQTPSTQEKLTDGAVMALLSGMDAISDMAGIWP